MAYYNTIRDLHNYIPEEHGCRCSECPLRDMREEKRFCPPEIRKGAVLTVVAEAPGLNEIEMKRPLVGPSGSMTMLALSRAGVERRQCSLTNVLKCRPPGGNLKKWLAGLGARNRRRKANGKDPLPSPMACCAPALEEDLSDVNGLLLLGAAARAAVYGMGAGSEKGLMRSRGFPSTVEMADGREVKALSTVHPAFALRAKRWVPIFNSDVAKCMRMVRGTLDWKFPEKVYFPKPGELRLVLQRMEGRTVSYDVETRPLGFSFGRGPESTTDVLRCIGIGTADLCTCVPFESCENGKWDLGWSAWYTAQEWAEIIDILREWFGDSSKVVCAHNEQYDRLVMRHQLPDVPVKRKVFDTVIAHHVAFSEYPHDLGFLEAQFTDATQHKAVDHARWESDRQLHQYCMDDVAVTSYCADVLAREPKLVEQSRTFHVDMWLGSFCREMHDIGIGFDVSERDRHYAELTDRMEKSLARFRQSACDSVELFGKESDTFLEGLNPGSPHQVRKFLFDYCGLDPVPADAGGFTDSGDPSVSRDNLLYLIDRGLPEELEETLQCLIDYREASKMRGTYCTVEPMRDGRVRANWNPHVVVSGRLSTSAPNLLNIKGAMRSMYCAQAGNEMVFCDKGQLELRIIAWLAQDKELIEAFLSGADVHVLNTAAILGVPADEVTKAERKFGKTFTYAVQYGAAAEKAWQMVRNFRQPDGERPYKEFTLEEAQRAFRRWWKARRAIKTYHELNREFWREHGYIEEPLHKRRRYFMDGEDPEAMANFPIQAAGAADVNDAMRRVVEVYPWNCFGPGTGVTHYNYDSIGLEVPKGMGLEVGARVTELMHSYIGDMPLPVDLGVGPNWYALTEYKKSEAGKWVEAD